MEKQGVTIRKMIEKTGLSDATILRARGDRIHLCRLSTLESIANCLNCKVKDLFEEL